MLRLYCDFDKDRWVTCRCLTEMRKGVVTGESGILPHINFTCSTAEFLNNAAPACCPTVSVGYSSVVNVS